MFNNSEENDTAEEGATWGEPERHGDHVFPSALRLVKESVSEWVLLGKREGRKAGLPCFFLFFIGECSAATERVYSLSFIFVVQFPLIVSKKLYEQDSY